VKHIAIGCDHRGFALKQLIVPFLQNAGYSSQDFGCYSTESVDYPDIAQKVGEEVASGNANQGILICNTGDVFAAQRARQHNDANVLCLRAENIDNESALEIVKTFLAVDFEGGKHLRRVDKIIALERDSEEQ